MEIILGQNAFIIFENPGPKDDPDYQEGLKYSIGKNQAFWMGKSKVLFYMPVGGYLGNIIRCTVNALDATTIGTEDNKFDPPEHNYKFRANSISLMFSLGSPRSFIMFEPADLDLDELNCASIYKIKGHQNGAVIYGSGYYSEGRTRWEKISRHNIVRGEVGKHRVASLDAEIGHFLESERNRFHTGPNGVGKDYFKPGEMAKYDEDRKCFVTQLDPNNRSAFDDMRRLVNRKRSTRPLTDEWLRANFYGSIPASMPEARQGAYMPAAAKHKIVKDGGKIEVLPLEV